MNDKQQQAITYVQENNLEKAAQLFIAYTEEQPEDPTGYINVGNVLVQLHQSAKAERFFLKAIEIDEKAATAFYGLGNLYYKEKQFEHANKMFTKAMALGLNDSDVYFMIGLTHVQGDQIMLAIPFLQRAVELDKDIEKLFQYGLALAKMNYYAEAKDIFTNLLQMEPAHADTLYNLGMIALQEQNDEQALYYLKKAVTVNTSHTLAKNAIQQIKSLGLDHE